MNKAKGLYPILPVEEVEFLAVHQLEYLKKKRSKKQLNIDGSS